MRIYLPPEGFPMEIPDDIPQMAPNVTLVHNSVWDQFGRPGDICLSEELDAKGVIDFLVTRQCRGVLQRNSAWFRRDIVSTLMIAENSEIYFKDPVKATLRQVQKSLVWDFTEAKDKDRIKDHLVRQIEAGNHVIRESVIAVFEELFMNATIDAPRLSIAQKLESHPYEKQPAAKLHFGVERGRLCLAAEDPYGTLNLQKFVQRMQEVYTKGAGQAVNLKSEQGGAGLGCVLLFEHSCALYLGVREGATTLVSCVMPTDLTHRQMDSIRKSIHLVQI